MAEIQPLEFPTEYLEAIDEVLMGATYAGRYNDGAAEFVGGRQISIPDIDFGNSPEPKPYNRFASEDGVDIKRTVYTLDHDDEKQFYVDALTVQDEPVASMTGVISEYERTVLAPYIDKYFFRAATGKAKTRATETLTASNIKSEIRKARTQFNSKGLSGWELYMSSNALALLEDATDRQWSNEGTILDTIGNYDGFQIYEVPSDLLQCDFLAVAGGKNTIKYIVKRAASFLFAPGQHQRGDGYLAQMRWVFGNLVKMNKQWGLYANGATSMVQPVGDRNALAGLSASPADTSKSYWGHAVTSLQEDVSISNGVVSGKLKKVTSGSLPDRWGAGHFLALKFDNPDAKANSF